RVLLGLAEPTLADRLRRGGLIPRLVAKDSLDAIRQAVPQFPLPDTLKRHLVQSMVEREEMAGTAMGRGLAFPHPRNPVIGQTDQEFVALAYLETPLDWGAADGVPVKAVFFLVSSSVQAHLKTLAALAKASRDPGFQALLDRQAPLAELTAWLGGRT
ncbi:MAG TPA: PTS sugar transporter subunit IIA, partial [Spirochaetia bacterium]|nr:PTS sugar transporter subunit IIA [Spirochaetia bacterium]